MKCFRCFNNVFRVIDEVALCFNCYTDLQNLSNNNVSSASQLHRGNDVAASMLRIKLLHNQNIEGPVKNEKKIEVNNYNTHNNITVQGNNNGILQAGNTLIQSNDTGIAYSSKPGNGTAGWLVKIITKGLQIAKFCLRLVGFFK